MRKPAFCICKNKGANQLCSNCTAEQCLCFCYVDSKITLQVSMHLLWLYSLVCVGAGRKTGRQVSSWRSSYITYHRGSSLLTLATFWSFWFISGCCGSFLGNVGDCSWLVTSLRQVYIETKGLIRTYRYGETHSYCLEYFGPFGLSLGVVDPFWAM